MKFAQKHLYDVNVLTRVKFEKSTWFVFALEYRLFLSLIFLYLKSFIIFHETCSEVFYDIAILHRVKFEKKQLFSIFASEVLVKEITD